jgi:CRISPR-associated protein Cas1
MAIIEDLIVSDYGAFVGLKGRRLRLSVPEQDTVDAPLMHLRSVRVLTRSASVSASAIAACCDAGIPLHFIDPVDGCYASVLSPELTTVVASRRCQMVAMQQPLGVTIALGIAHGKLKSQIVNLRYLSRRVDDDDNRFHMAELDITDCIAQLDTLRGESVDEIRAELMGIEGRASRIYWEALSWLIPDDYAWPGRTGRHAEDPVNSLLNYGYGILYSEVQNALVIAGLEPYVGLIHTDRPGKPSLTLDFIEEFRAPVVDRTVIGLVRRGFNVDIDDNGRMTRDTRRSYADHILSRLNAQGTYRRKRYQLRSIIQMQARLLAAAFRDDARYTAYTGG